MKRIISDVYEIVPLHAKNMRLDVYNGNNKEYAAYDNGTTIRYYLTINGVITNQFVDIAKDNKSQELIVQNYDVSGNITVLPILLEYDTISTTTEEKHLIYFVKNNVATPVLISYITITAEDGTVYSDAVCRNLNNGEYMDYADIGIVQEVEINVNKN